VFTLNKLSYEGSVLSVFPESALACFPHGSAIFELRRLARASRFKASFCIYLALRAKRSRNVSGFFLGEKYQHYACDLIIAGSEKKITRLQLEAG
jgi:hypothetical protein